MRSPHKLDRTRQAAPQVFERLRAAILSLELVPGAVLSRLELAERFAVSQTPVRDALLKLGQEGLVDIFPQHTTLVSRIDISSARQAHFLRCAIELEVVRTLAVSGGDTAALPRLRAQVDLQAALAGGKPEEFMAADQAFHRLMYEAAGVPDLYDLVQRMGGHIDRLRRLDLPSEGKAKRVVRDHRRILDALVKHDPAAAQEALRDHLSDTLSRIADIRIRFPDYMTE